MAYLNLLFITAFILAYSLFAKRIEKTVVSGALLATLFGIVAGPLFLSFFKIEIESEDYKVIAELALALVLFTDASKTNMKSLSLDALLPKRLLMVGLPLTIGLGTLVAYLIFPEFSVIEMGILATLLAPTDAALGKPVVTNEAVPLKIREGLNVESGLNDGICVPVLLLIIGLQLTDLGQTSTHTSGLLLFIEEIGIGVVIGFGLTYLLNKVLLFATHNDMIAESWKPIIIAALSFSIFALTQILGGSGFIACFVGGLTYAWLNKNHHSPLLEAAEGFGDTLSLFTWLIFGSAVLYATISAFTLDVVLYALLSLTVIRMVPVFISLVGTTFSFKEKFFISWFGPRGLASIVFAIMVLEVDFPHVRTIVLTAVCTILFSIILHSITAKPLIRNLGKTEVA